MKEENIVDRIAESERSSKMVDVEDPAERNICDSCQ